MRYEISATVFVTNMMDRSDGSRFHVAGHGDRETALAKVQSRIGDRLAEMPHCVPTTIHYDVFTTDEEDE